MIVWQNLRMLDLSSVAVVLAVGVVMFLAGVAVGRGPVRRRRDAEVGHIVDRAVEASSQRMQEASAPIAERAVSIDARLQGVDQAVRALQSEAATDRGTIKNQLEGVADTTRRLSQVLDKPTSRGGWGEGHVEGALRAAGFLEGVDYDTQRALPNGGKPDFTVYLPRGLKLHVDVKVPQENFQRYADASDATEREDAKKAFMRDVDKMVKDLAGRKYSAHDDSVSLVVMCVPNESIYAFMHEADPLIIDKALKRGVVLCSTSTLFAVLAVVRQSVKNFQLEKRTGEVLKRLDEFHQEWSRFATQLETADRQFGTFSKSWGSLSGTRRDKLQETVERIRQIEHSNTEPADGEHAVDSDRQASIMAPDTSKIAAAD